MEKSLQQKARYKGFEDALKLVEHIKAISLQTYHVSAYWQHNDFLLGKVTPELVALAEESVRIVNKSYNKAQKTICKYRQFDFNSPLARRTTDIEEAMSEFRKAHKELSDWIDSHKVKDKR